MILDPLGANDDDDDDDDDDDKPAKLENSNLSSIGNNVHSSKLSQLLYPTDTKNKQSSPQKGRCVVILTVKCHIYIWMRIENMYKDLGKHYHDVTIIKHGNYVNTLCCLHIK